MRTLPRRWRIFIGVTSAFLLITMGAQIVASPLSVPGLWWAARSTPRVAGRIGFSVIAGLTMLFVSWFAVYTTIGERQPYILGAPLVALFATTALFIATTRRARR
jgi:hypothetical protein